jgi:hypothetical protein
VQHYLFLSAGVLSHVDKKLGIITNHSLLQLQKRLAVVFLTSYKTASTSSSITLTSVIVLAIAFPHSLSKVSMGHGPVSALYQNSFAASLLRLLSASTTTILLQSEFGESFCGTSKIIGLQASHLCRHGNLPPHDYTHIPSPSDYSAYTLEVDLLCFSLGGQHPSAREPTLIVRDVSRAEQGLDLEIRGDLLAVLVPLSGELFVFAWKTGQNIAVSGIGLETHLSLHISPKCSSLKTDPSPHSDSCQIRSS